MLTAEILQPAGPVELQQTIDWFVERGFRLDAILPADAPRVATMSGHGIRLRFDRDADVAPATLRLGCASTPLPAPCTAPNGTRVESVLAEPPVVVPGGPLTGIEHTRAASTDWSPGRAGMLYRDLVPSRLGGRLIASRIQVPSAGPVPDYVHYHRVRFQLIYCRRGSVRLAYEGQGAPFWAEAGDLVLQPPTIRHRVLEIAPGGLEVIELGCPAVHETRVDHDVELPGSGEGAGQDPQRAYGDGQRFVWHRGGAGDVGAQAWRGDAAFTARDLGVRAATDGLVTARVVDAASGGKDAEIRTTHDTFWFVLDGSTRIVDDGTDLELCADDTVVLPADRSFRLQAGRTLRLLEVELPPAEADS